jgi:hypothetical protein
VVSLKEDAWTARLLANDGKEIQKPCCIVQRTKFVLLWTHSVPTKTFQHENGPVEPFRRTLEHAFVSKSPVLPTGSVCRLIDSTCFQNRQCSP